MIHIYMCTYVAYCAYRAVSLPLSIYTHIHIYVYVWITFSRHFCAVVRCIFYSLYSSARTKRLVIVSSRPGRSSVTD